jgi:endonuclease YncB( thermonuclease family)
MIHVAVFAIAALCSFFQGQDLLAAEFKATVTRVIDGDSFEVSHDNGALTIRLHGVDAPEISQPYGRIAMVAIFRHIFGKVVRIETHGLDSHGRTIGEVYLPDDTLLNHEMVRLGLAWWYCKHSHDEDIRQLELEAREAKLGLWKDSQPSPPWVFRQRYGLGLDYFDGRCLPLMHLTEIDVAE